MGKSDPFECISTVQYLFLDYLLNASNSQIVPNKKIPREKTISDLSLDAILVMMGGGVALALPFTVIGYYLAFHFFLKIRKKRREKHILH